MSDHQAEQAPPAESAIACSLDEADLPGRQQEWRAALSRAVARSDRVSPDRLELTLRPELAGLRGLILLAQREKACCTFFDFSLRVEADTVTFVVDVPGDAAALLDDVATLTSAA